MNGPYGLEVSDSCQTCKLRGSKSFCQLSPAAVKDFDAIKSTTTYPAGSVLFVEQQDPRGAFVLCAGKAKLTMSSSGGKTLIVRIAKPGEALGLMATMTGSPYEATAETIYPSQVVFIRRDDFLRFVAEHPDMYHAVIEHLGKLYSGACEQLRTVGLSGSAREKLARLLLDWSAEGRETQQGTQITVPLTHEEIAEFAGTTRETITRTLSEFRAKNFVKLHGSIMMISNRPALETIVGI